MTGGEKSLRRSSIARAWLASLLFAAAMAGCAGARNFTIAGTRAAAEPAACGTLGGCAGAVTAGAARVALLHGDYDSAIAAYSEIIGTKPRDRNAYEGRGLAYLAKGNYGLAAADFDAAIHLNPNDGLAYNNRGVAYYRKGDYGRAIADYDEALRLATAHIVTPIWLSDAYWNRAAAYYAEGNYGQAIADYDTVIRRLPNDENPGHTSTTSRENPRLAAAHIDRATAYASNGDYDRAIDDFTAALTLQDPKEPLTYDARGNAYFAKGDRNRAAGDYHAAAQMLADNLESITDDAATFNAAGWILATCPDATYRHQANALKYANHACELTKRENPVYLDTLAAAFAESGYFTQAIEAEQQAIAKSLIAFNTSAYRKRLALYQSGKPYRSDMK